MTSTDISDRFACVLLAAGSSRRLGQPKQLVEYKGEALITRGARNLLNLGAVEVIVVTGSEERKVLNKINNMAVKTVYNAAWKQGMGGSVSTGVRSLPGGVAGVLILLCDQWRVDSRDLESLVKSWQSDISGVFSAKWGDLDEGAFGPPVIFPKRLFSELESLDSEQGARGLIRKYWQQVTFVDMENAAFDLDDPEDLKVMQAS
jgi:molybdenum cofactor cytidylyltransferase